MKPSQVYDTNKVTFYTRMLRYMPVPTGLLVSRKQLSA